MGTGVPSPSSAPTLCSCQSPNHPHKPRKAYQTPEVSIGNFRRPQRGLRSSAPTLLRNLPTLLRCSRQMPAEPSELNKVTGKCVNEANLLRWRASRRTPPKNARYIVSRICRSSPRSISTAKLKTSLPLHTQPIYHVVFMGSYLITQWDILS